MQSCAYTVKLEDGMKVKRRSYLDFSLESTVRDKETGLLGTIVAKQKHQDLIHNPSPNVVRSLCPYCGVGCSVDYHVAKGRIVYATGSRDGPTNRGMLCVKGRFGYDYVLHPDRLTTPLIRKEGSEKGRLGSKDKSSVFRKASWKEAITVVAKRLGEIKEDYGSEAVGGLSCAKDSNEENYVFQKFVRACLQTNNVDHCSRLCRSSSIHALEIALGNGAATNSIGEIQDSDVIVVAGSNTTENHPVVASYIKRAVKNGSMLIAIDPRRINLVKHAHLHLQLKPGTDVALLNAMAHVIIKEKLVNEEFVEKRTEGFEECKKSVEPYGPEAVESITGVKSEKIIAAARLYAKAKAAVIYWGTGISKHTNGSDNTFAIINLALLTGHVGKHGAGLNPLSGHNNVQGASDMGCFPSFYPSYQPIEDDNVRKKFEELWKVKLPRKNGLASVEMVKAMLDGRIRALYVMGENQIFSNSSTSRVEDALKSLEFLAVQDIFLTETAELADVVMPSAGPLEKDGTYVNTERRIQWCRRVVNPPGESRPDWITVCEISSKMGYPMHYKRVEEITDEIAKASPLWNGATHDRIGASGIQWPCPENADPGTAILHLERFAKGLGSFMPVKFAIPEELITKEYPFILSTGRRLTHWNTGTMTRKAKVLNAISPENYVEMSSDDFKRMDLKRGEMVKVKSKRGEVIVPVVPSKAVMDGTVFLSFDLEEAAANSLTLASVDLEAKESLYKLCSVNVEKAESIV